MEQPLYEPNITIKSADLITSAELLVYFSNGEIVMYTAASLYSARQDDDNRLIPKTDMTDHQAV